MAIVMAMVMAMVMETGNNLQITAYSKITKDSYYEPISFVK